MLMIILGAGASYDSYSSNKPPKSLQGKPKVFSRPPLADELFEDRPKFNELLKEFSPCQEILPQLRAQSKKKSLEGYLERLREEAQTDLRAKQQLMAIKYYIQEAIEHCESSWREVHLGATNHLALLNRVERWRVSQNESVAIVTFNYDTLMEEALSSRLSRTFRYLNDYVQRSDYKLFKLHGSVDWGHVTLCAIQEHEYNSHRAIQQHIINRVNSTGTHIDPNRYEKRSSEAALKRQALALSPAIAIPVKNKDSFECPKDHIEALKANISQADKIIIIGWRAQEQHFMKYLKALPAKPRILVVGGNPDDVEQTIGGLIAADVKGNYTKCSGGFSLLLESDEMLDKFLRD